MKVRSDRVNLIDSLNAIVGIVPTNSTKPILKDFHLATESGSLVAEATDLELSGRVLIHKVEILDEGAISLPSDRLLAMVKELPGDLVTITSRDAPHGAIIEAEGFELKIMGNDPDEFPRTVEPETPNTFKVDRQNFHDALRRVSVGTSRDTTRYQLNGVFLEFEGAKLTFTATDGKRLTHDHIRIDNSDACQISAILPNQAIDVFLKVLSSPGAQEETVSLALSETDVTLKTKDSRISSNLIDGIYPNYQSVFPPAPKLKVKGQRLALIAAARSAALTTDKETSTVAFRVTPDGLIFESNAQDVGESHIEVEIVVDGEAMEVRFNPVYFIDALRTFDEDEVTIELTEPSKPAVLRASTNYRHLVMPLVNKK